MKKSFVGKRRRKSTTFHPIFTPPSLSAFQIAADSDLPLGLEV
jgi:hypothetical protein